MARRETGRNNEAGRLVTELFFFFVSNSFRWGKSKWLAPKFQYILEVPILLNLEMQ